MTVISYGNILEQFPWIAEREKRCILSPDSDGFLCGLFMSSLLNWEISGFYDGKVLLLSDGLNVEDCIFLDMDVNRATIRSMGHHMVVFNKRVEHDNLTYGNCIQPNIFRNFDGTKDFGRKYPFGTIHLLLGILQKAGLVNQLPENAIWPLLFTDGVWNNLFGYTENCLDWIEHLGATDQSHILHYLFYSNPHNTYQIMAGVNKFLRERDSFNAKGAYENGEYKERKTSRTGDKLRISNSKGQLINLEESTDGLLKIHHHEKERIINFISRMGKYAELEYMTDKWAWDNLSLIELQKSSFNKDGTKINKGTYIQLLDKHPFSLAMRSSRNIEYTLWPDA